MTHRERFVNLFMGRPVDRAPFLDYMGVMGATLARWQREGMQTLPGETPFQAYLREMGFDSRRGLLLPLKTLVWPEFEECVLGERDGRIYRRNRWGETLVDLPGSEFMAIAIEGPVKTHADWDALRERLVWDTPGRLTDDWPGWVRRAHETTETVHAGDLPAGFFGAMRELLTYERFAELLFDDPAWVCEMLDTLCDLWIGLATRIQRDVSLDWWFIWEDMCFKGGPLMSPRQFDEFLAPRYHRLISAVRAGGCPLVLVDSDGDTRPLTQNWLDCGVNVIMPWESQFGLDLRDVRARWPELGILGGISEQALEHGRAAIDAELEKVPELLRAGRFLPAIDHNLTPNISFADAKYFFGRLREMILTNPPPGL